MSPPAGIVATCPPHLCCCLLSSLFAMLPIDPPHLCCCLLSPTFMLWCVVLPWIMVLQVGTPPSTLLSIVSPPLCCCESAPCFHVVVSSFISPPCHLSSPPCPLPAMLFITAVVWGDVALFISTSIAPYEQWLAGGWLVPATTGH
jgi:hypothetical protein